MYKLQNQTMIQHALCCYGRYLSFINFVFVDLTKAIFYHVWLLLFRQMDFILGQLLHTI